MLPERRPGSRTGAYVASSYDALVDAPVEIGQFDEFRIEAGGRPIRIVVHGDAGDRARLTDALKRIVDYDVSLMGGAPFREYLFLVSRRARILAAEAWSIPTARPSPRTFPRNCRAIRRMNFFTPGT